jgi:hypothetical protein
MEELQAGKNYKQGRTTSREELQAGKNYKQGRTTSREELQAGMLVLLCVA